MVTPVWAICLETPATYPVNPARAEFDNPKTLVAFALGLTLFFVTLLLNLYALKIVQKYRERYE